VANANIKFEPEATKRIIIIIRIFSIQEFGWQEIIKAKEKTQKNLMPVEK
jgi:hypothetical protein